MQHTPHGTRLVEADLDEVIARAKRAEVAVGPIVRPSLPQLGMLVEDAGEASRHDLGNRLDDSLRQVVPRTAVARATVVGAPVRDAPLDLGPEAGKATGQIGTRE